MSTYDCQKCGACCIDAFSLVGYVSLTPEEATRLDRVGLPIVSVLGEEFLTRRCRSGERVCAAFSGTVGARCGCTIYAERPDACRQFEMGSVSCKGARRDAGLPV